MIDVTTAMIVSVGVFTQAAAPARRVIAALRPRLRGPGVLASIAFTPLPQPSPVLDAIVASIAAPETPDR